MIKNSGAGLLDHPRDVGFILYFGHEFDIRLVGNGDQQQFTHQLGAGRRPPHEWLNSSVYAPWRIVAAVQKLGTMKNLIRSPGNKVPE